MTCRGNGLLTASQRVHLYLYIIIYCNAKHVIQVSILKFTHCIHSLNIAIWIGFECVRKNSIHKKPVAGLFPNFPVQDNYATV
jgi:hypothetical protein